MSIKVIYLLLTYSLAGAASESWVSHPPTWVRYATNVPRANFQEVDAARLDGALSLLESKEITLVSEIERGTFLSGVLSCPAGTQSYLVRAVRGFRGTGSFSVQQSEDALFIHHGSLGRSSPTPEKTALVVCLKSVPHTVYGEMSVAE